MATNLLLILTNEIHDLEEHRSRLLSELRKVEDRIEYATFLQGKFRGKTDRRTPKSSPAIAVEMEGNGDTVASQKVRPSQAVRDYLRRHPGVSSKQLIDGIVDHIETTSAKPRRALDSLIRQMIKSKRVISSGTKGLRLADPDYDGREERQKGIFDEK